MIIFPCARELIFSNVFISDLTICLIFFGFLRFNQLWYEEGETQPLNPFYYFSRADSTVSFAARESTLNRGGAILWAYSTLKDDVKLFAGRGVGWFRNLTSKQLAEFRKLTIGYEFPLVLLLCGIFGLLIFFYLAYNLFKMRIQITIANPELNFLFYV